MAELELEISLRGIDTNVGVTEKQAVGKEEGIEPRDRCQGWISRAAAEEILDELTPPGSSLEGLRTRFGRRLEKRVGREVEELIMKALARAEAEQIGAAIQSPPEFPLARSLREALLALAFPVEKGPIESSCGPFLGPEIGPEEGEVIKQVVVDVLAFLQGRKEESERVKKRDVWGVVRALSLLTGDVEKEVPEEERRRIKAAALIAGANPDDLNLERETTYGPPSQDMFGSCRPVDREELRERMRPLLNPGSIQALKGAIPELDSLEISALLTKGREERVAYAVRRRWGDIDLFRLAREVIDEGEEVLIRDLVLAAEALKQRLEQVSKEEQVSEEVLDYIKALDVFLLSFEQEEGGSGVYPVNSFLEKVIRDEDGRGVPEEWRELPIRLIFGAFPGAVRVERKQGEDGESRVVFEFPFEVERMTMEELVVAALDRFNREVSVGRLAEGSRPLTERQMIQLVEEVNNIFNTTENGGVHLLSPQEPPTDMRQFVNELLLQLEENGFLSLRRDLGGNLREFNEVVLDFVLAHLARRLASADCSLRGIGSKLSLAGGARADHLFDLEPSLRTVDRTHPERPILSVAEVRRRIEGRPLFTIDEIERGINSFCPGQEKAARAIAEWLFTNVGGKGRETGHDQIKRRGIMITGLPGTGKTAIARTAGEVAKDLMRKARGTAGMPPMIVIQVDGGGMTPEGFKGLSPTEIIGWPLILEVMRAFKVSIQEAIAIVNGEHPDIQQPVNYIVVDEGLNRVVPGERERTAVDSAAYLESLRRELRGATEPGGVRLRVDGSGLGMVGKIPLYPRLMIVLTGSLSQAREAWKKRMAGLSSSFPSDEEIIREAIPEKDWWDRFEGPVTLRQPSSDALVQGWRSPQGQEPGLRGRLLVTARRLGLPVAKVVIDPQIGVKMIPAVARQRPESQYRVLNEISKVLWTGAVGPLESIAREEAFDLFNGGWQTKEMMVEEGGLVLREGGREGGLTLVLTPEFARDVLGRKGLLEEDERRLF